MKLIEKIGLTLWIAGLIALALKYSREGNGPAVFMAILGMFMWANAVVDAERLAEKEAQLNLCREMYRKDTEGFADVLVTEATEKEKGRTYLEDFMEKYPNVPKDSDDLPISCVEDIYGHSAVDEELCSRCRCADCWNRKMKTEEEKV